MLPWQADLSRGLRFESGRSRFSIAKIPYGYSGTPARRRIRGTGVILSNRSRRPRRRSVAGPRTPLDHSPAPEGTLDLNELAMLEIPYSKKMVDAFVLAAGGSDFSGAARAARRRGVQSWRWVPSPPIHRPRRRILRDPRRSGGDPAHAERGANRARHGNRHRRPPRQRHRCDTFAEDPAVFTLSIHQYHNYPQFKPPSNVDIHLGNGVADAEYSRAFGRGLPEGAG